MHRTIWQSQRALEVRRNPSLLEGIRGLQFHTNCDAPDFEPLLGTVRHVEARLRDWLPHLRWMNLGGGYLLDPSVRVDPLVEAVERLKARYQLDVFIEPGAALVREAAELLLAAERPVIYAGGGILRSRAAESLRELAGGAPAKVAR